MKSVAIRALAECSQPVSGTAWYDQTWAINNAGYAYGFLPDLIVAMDDLQRDWDSGHHEAYVEAIVNTGCKVYSARSHEQWPTVEPYPLKEVLDKLGMRPSHWSLFDNSCCYALALALARGFERIGLYGFDFVRPYDKMDLKVENFRWKLKGYDCPDWFAYHAENVVWKRAPQEPGYESLHWWIGFGTAKGVEIELGPNTAIMNRDRTPHFYGYQEQPDLP